MAYDVIHKNSTVAGTPPTAGEVEVGEIAINAADAELYTKDTSGTIREFISRFVRSDAGATPRAVSEKLGDIVSVKDFGAVGDGATDDTAAIQAAINVNSSTGNALYFPAGTYIIKSTLTSSGSGQIVLRGDGLYRSTIKWASAAAGTLFDAGVWGLDLRDIGINGAPSGGDFWRAGDTAIKTTGVLSVVNSRLLGFETLIDWDGGYYHKFDNSIFARCNTVIATANANNLQFSQCRFTQFIDGISYNAGVGPITINQCSVENWTGQFIQSTAGARSAVTIQGSYFENYPATATTPPMASGFYDSGIVTVNPSTLCVTGCLISLKGIRRFLTTTVPVSNLSSIGNRFIYSSGAAATCQYVYYATSYESLLLADFANDIGGETGGSYTTSYLAGSLANPTRSSGYNAITGASIGVTAQVADKPDYEKGTWTPAMSGSGGSAGSFSAVSLTGTYVKIGDQVTAYFRLVGGIPDLGSWTGDVRISLPFTAVAPNPASVVSPVSVRVYGASGSGYTARIDDGNAYFEIFKYPGGAILTPEKLQWSDLSTSSSGAIFATLTYIAA